MAHRLPPLTSLRAFEAAARLLSFKDAAEELFLTPSAVSRSIQVLEDWLGSPVFLRGNRSIALTESGTAYAVRVRAALDDLAEATAAMPGRRGPAALHISAAPTFTRKWLMLRLGRFRAEHPEIALSLDASHRQVDILRDGVDLAIRMGAGPWPEVEALHLVGETLVPVCTPQMAGRIGSPADLAGATLLQVSGIATDWDWWFGAAGVDRPAEAAAMRFDTVQLALDAALQGLGIALGRRPLVDAELEAGTLVEVLGPPRQAGSAYWLLWLAASERRAEIRAFLNWIRLELAAEATVPAPAG